MSDIFISYKREEQAIARKLANALESEGWSVWWDPKLRAGEHFDDVIEKALNEAKCVIVMWSNLAVNSEYIKAEATEALEQRKLVPIKIENVNLPFRFKRVHTPSLLGWDGSKDLPEFRRLLDDIATILGRRKQAGAKEGSRQQEREWSKEEITKSAFFLRIEDIFFITGRTVVTGVVESGTCQVGQEVAILENGIQLCRAVVLGIEKFREVTDTAKTGDNVGIILKDVVKEELKRGMVLISRN